MKTQLMSPPDDGNRNGMSINGRRYQSIPGVAVPIPPFDVAILEANGWQIFVGAASPITTASYSSGSVSGVVTSPGGSAAGLGVRLYLDGSASPVGVTAADVGGAWSIMTGALSAGSHSFSIEIDEGAGVFVSSGGASSGVMDFSTALNSGLIAAIAA
ncbi:conserved hypothetical protein [Methylocella silvestris BL2]|uniref:Bacterial Ig-like domain-containing protein n=1 Tax=Methylocella silvestris (strain DSM 15510 / CIP 108128 / LMG 27833 / NCIMB 13906 / BL2) TaxID=395965 RepID=B8EKU2_METSB|nr:hypothetical protein [Methylocella silvestris]ACK51970.1 conserved hypothetical protein [Methylocella silvestris BL2]